MSARRENPGDDGISDRYDGRNDSDERVERNRELADYLRSLEPDDRYRVEQTLRDSPHETTQIVYRLDDGGSGPYVRKVFSRDAGRGMAYQNIYQQRARGVQFIHQPEILEFEQHEDTISVVMEYVAGETLAWMVECMGPSVDLAASVGCELCDAMMEIHEQVVPPLIHRDIKPSNIMYSQGRLVLVDLGIARLQREGASCDTVHLGTPGYAPPEQYGYSQTSVRSDIYAAGMVLAFCLLGEQPNAVLREGGFVDERIPIGFRPVLAKATAFDPDARYQSAREMKAAIQEAANAAKQVSEDSDVVQPGRFAWAGRIWNAVLLTAWVVLMGVVVSGIFFPSDYMATRPLYYRMVGYLTVLGIPPTALCYALLDKRDLKRHVPQLARFSRQQEFAACGIAVAIDFAVIVLFVVLITF